ncbi:MAG: hypothetical protein JW809_15400 [Pirellulales bacterium]|nr:hypothetical protein [Pirellulales bacterium]
MNRRRIGLLVGVACVALWTAAVGQAAENVLDLVPQKALGFVAVNGLSSCDAKVATVSGAAGVPVPSPFALIKAKLGLEKGIDEKGVALLVLMPGDSPDDEPRPVIFVPTADYDAFVGQFKPEKVTDAIQRITFKNAHGLVAKKNNFAVVVEQQRQGLLEAVLDGKSLADDLGKWQPWIARCDVVAIGTQPAVKLFCEKGDEALENAKDMMVAMGGEQGEAAVAGLGMYQKILALVKKDVTAIGVGVVVEEDGSVRIVSRGSFSPEGELGKLLANVEPLSESSLVGVPKGPFVVTGAGPLPETLMKPILDVSFDMIKSMPKMYGLTPEQTEKMAELSAESMKGVRGMSMTLGVPKAGDPIYNGATGAMLTTDAEGYIDTYVTQMTAMKDAVKDAPDSMFSGMTVEKMEVEGRPGAKVVMDLSKMLAKMAVVSPQSEVFKKMYGPKAVVYLMAADSKHVVFGYGDPTVAGKAAAAVTDPESGLASDEEVAKTAAKLPAGAQWRGYWSPEGTVSFVGAIMSAVLPPEMNVKIPPIGPMPPVGFAATASADAMEKELYVPVEVIRKVAAYVIRQIAPPTTM